MASLGDVFGAFCGAGRTDMDGRGFAKLVKDCGLLDKKFTATDVDLIFAKVVTKGQRRIDLVQFESALHLIAVKKGTPSSNIQDAVVGAGGPVLSGTKTDDVRFHDDKSTYTGTHVNGGPASVAKGEGTAGQALLPVPRPAGAASGAAASPRSAASPRGAATSPRAKSPAVGAKAPPSPTGPSQGQAAGSVEAAFNSFCAGQPGMDGKTFVKACKDCRLIDKSFSPTDADLLFAKVCPKGGRRINLGQFKVALDQVAAKKGVAADVVVGLVASSSGPVLSGTTADAVRFHDDKSTYTGVHQHGGPEAVAVGGGTATQLAANGMRMGQ